jgi:hypothetical protein
MHATSYTASSLETLLSTAVPGRRRALSNVLFGIKTAERVLSIAGSVPDTCLFRALARYDVLCCAGFHPTFVMGLDATTMDLKGHAWIELDGESVFERVSETLVPTMRYSAPNGAHA